MCKICIRSDITSFLLWQLLKKSWTRGKMKLKIYPMHARECGIYTLCIVSNAEPPPQAKMSNAFQNFMTFFCRAHSFLSLKKLYFNSIYLWLFAKTVLSFCWAGRLLPWFSRCYLTNNNNIKYYTHTQFTIHDTIKRKATPIRTLTSSNDSWKKGKTSSPATTTTTTVEYYSHFHMIASEILLANGKFTVYVCEWIHTVCTYHI